MNYILLRNNLIDIKNYKSFVKPQPSLTISLNLK